MDNLFLHLSTALEANLFVSLGAALLWGILSIILSPCHLSSIPLVMAYILAQTKENNKSPLLTAFYFSLGILISISLIGVLTALLGRLLGDIGVIGSITISAVFMLTGLFLLDIIKLDWSTPLQKFSFIKGLTGAFIFGFIFGIGLGPCTFAFMAPVLGIVFKVASTQLTYALLLLAFFAIGHCLIIMLAGSLAGLVQKYLNWGSEKNRLIWAKKLVGLGLLGVGVYMIFKII